MIAKSTRSLKSLTMSLNLANFAMKGGQLELPKFSTKGLPIRATSKSRTLLRPSALIRGESTTSVPSLTFFRKSIIFIFQHSLNICQPNRESQQFSLTIFIRAFFAIFCSTTLWKNGTACKRRQIMNSMANTSVASAHLREISEVKLCTVSKDCILLLLCFSLSVSVPFNTQLLQFML